MIFNAITKPQLATAVGRLYGVDKPRTSSVSGEVQVTTSPWERPEFWALNGGWLFSGMSVVNGALRPQIQLYNPANSGVLAIIEKTFFWHGFGAAQRLTGILGTAALATSSGNVITDTRRWNGSASGFGALPQVRQEDFGIAVAGQIFADLLVSATQPGIPWDAPIVLSPGFGVTWTPSGAGAGILAVTFTGRSRPAPLDELGPL